MKTTWCGLKIKENYHVLVNQFHGNVRSKTLGCKKIKCVFRDVKWWFNASWGFKGLKQQRLSIWCLVADCASVLFKCCATIIQNRINIALARRQWPNVVLMLGQRLRRWANIEPTHSADRSGKHIHARWPVYCTHTNIYSPFMASLVGLTCSTVRAQLTTSHAR